MTQMVEIWFCIAQACKKQNIPKTPKAIQSREIEEFRATVEK